MDKKGKSPGDGDFHPENGWVLPEIQTEMEEIR